jgi:hypothetical protein
MCQVKNLIRKDLIPETIVNFKHYNILMTSMLRMYSYFFSKKNFKIEFSPKPKDAAVGYFLPILGHFWAS